MRDWFSEAESEDRKPLLEIFYSVAEKSDGQDMFHFATSCLTRLLFVRASTYGTDRRRADCPGGGTNCP